MAACVLMKSMATDVYVGSDILATTVKQVKYALACELLGDKGRKMMKEVHTLTNA